MTFDATFVAFLALAIFVGLMIYLKIPAQITKALDDRSAQIAKELTEARKLREEAQALYREYEAKKAAAEKEAKDIIAHAKEQADLMSAELRVQNEEAIKRRRQQAEERIARAAQQAEADVRAAAADAAIRAAERILREDLDATAHARLVSEGARELEKKFG
ncbi:MAG: ATP F0F1 synthase subunit B [Hyphomonadaceae bacterium]